MKTKHQAHWFAPDPISRQETFATSHSKRENNADVEWRYARVVDANGVLIVEEPPTTTVAAADRAPARIEE